MSKDDAIYTMQNFNFILVLYFFSLYIKISETTHYQWHWETMLKRIKIYYQNKKEVLRKRAKNKYRELSQEDENAKRSRYRDLSEKEKEKLKEY